MDCPRCGGPQPTPDGRFCPRCGFPLTPGGGRPSVLSIGRVLLAAVLAVVSVVFGLLGTCAGMVGMQDSGGALLMAVVCGVLALGSFWLVVKILKAEVSRR